LALHGAVAAVAMVLAAGSALAAGPVKIGLDLEFSAGPYVPLAHEVANGLAMAIADEGGSIDGRKIVIIDGDNESKPDIALSVAKRLVYADHVDMLVGPIGSGVVKAIRDFAVASKTPLLIPNAGDNEITGKDCNFYVMRTSFSNDQIVRDMGPWEVKHGIKRVALIAFDYAAGHQQMAGFKRTFTKAGGKIVSEQYPPFGPISDFSPYLTKIKEAHPDAVFTFFAGPPATAFVKQFKEFGLAKTIKLTGPGWIVSPLNLPSEGLAAVGVIGILNYVPAIDNPVNHKFQKEFEAKYHRVGSEFAAQGYDTGLLIYAALKTTHGKIANKAALVRAFHHVKVDGTRGELRIDPKTNNIIQNLYIFKVVDRDGKPAYHVIKVIPHVQDPPNGCKLG
ncbi:MAG: ABC transporter substrate-binding protein, partial [Stellaceae bacterium]